MTEQNESANFSQSNFLIVGLARNCEKKIRRDILAISRAVSQCRSLSWLIVESDSTDKTVDALGKISHDFSDFRVLSLGSLRESLPLRTQRLAHCRNVYLNELQSNPLYANVDYVIVADLDGVNTLLTASGLISCWEKTGWDVCTANQRGPYYDIWALRHKIWSPCDCLTQNRFLVAHGIRREAARQAAIYSKMITIAEDSEWIEVDSAFGGLAVYRRAALTGVEYVGLDDASDEICEHVTLHKQIKTKGGHIYINPRLINIGKIKHSQVHCLVPRLKRLYWDCCERMKS